MTTHTDAAPQAPTRRRRASLERSQQLWGWIFLAPWIIGFVAFTALPIVASLVFSFTRFELTRPDEVGFVGFDNYRKLFTDPLVRVSLGVTVKFALIALPISVLLPIALAALLNSPHLAGRRVFRTLFYMPYIVPVVSAVYVWRGVLNSETGWLNRILQSFGLLGPDWLNSMVWIYPALVIIGLWGVGNAYLITLASMQGVPTAFYEAARVDGATGLQRFRHITLPMISPVIFYNLVLSVIGLMRYFEIPFILSNGTGRPGDATMFFNIHFYKTTFVFFDMGYGSTLAWLLFLITIALTLLLFATARYWVYYAGERS
jgi:multiple sugar transport system permease protein